MVRYFAALWLLLAVAPLAAQADFGAPPPETNIAGGPPLAAGAQPITVDAVDELAPALAGTAPIWLRLNAAAISPEMAAAVLAWTARGGLLLTDTDAATLFGFSLAPTAPAERLGHARRACGLQASPLLAQVDHIYYRLADNGVLLVAHPNALPLLRAADSNVAYPTPRYVMAELQYGRGLLVFRPAEIHPLQGDGQRLLMNLDDLPQTAPQVRITVASLEAAAALAERAATRFARAPEEAQQLADQVWQRYRLWHAGYLLDTGRLQDAQAALTEVAAALPEDPEVYLAVAELNEALGLSAPAAAARAKALERYAALRQAPPTADTPQLRLSEPVFRLAVEAAYLASGRISAEALAKTAGRTAYLAALGLYRRGDLDGAERLLQQATRRLGPWAPVQFRLGLLYASRADNIRQASPVRAQLWNAAAEQFFAAAMGQASADFTAAGQAAAGAWRTRCVNQAQQALREPRGIYLTPTVVVRYDPEHVQLRTEQALQVYSRPFINAHTALGQAGLWLDPVEVLLYADTASMTAALPRTAGAQRVFLWTAPVGRRIYAVQRTDDLALQARHAMVHVGVNASGGQPQVPLWLAEGLAALLENDPQKLMAARLNVRQGQVATVPQLNDPNMFYDPRYSYQLQGQSALMSELLLSRLGAPRLGYLLYTLGWHPNADDALRALVNARQDDFVAALRAGRARM